MEDNKFRDLFDLFGLTDKHQIKVNLAVNELQEAINAFDEKKAREIVENLKNEGYDVSEYIAYIDKVFAKASL